MVSLTCSEDVASILASPLNNVRAAIDQCYFNCGTDKLHSYTDVAYLCAQAAGIPQENVKIESFDPVAQGKGKFPFRPTNFYVAPDLAKAVLGWKGTQHDLSEDLKSWYYSSYVERGGPTKEL